MDRRAVADRLAARRGGIGVEAGGQEDRAALGVEVEHLGRVGRQPEAVRLGPRADVVAAALEDRDVERVDPRLEEDLERRQAAGAASRGEDASGTGGWVSRMSRWRVQSPPRSTLDGMPGSGVIEPNVPPPPANAKAVT